MGLKAKSITLITITRFDVTLRDTTSPRLWGNIAANVMKIVRTDEEMGSYAFQPQKKSHTLRQ